MKESENAQRIWIEQCPSVLLNNIFLIFAFLSHGRMRHTDSRPSAYGNSMLWLSSFPPIKVRYFIVVFQAKWLSHSIELPYTEGRESVCLIRPWDSASLSFFFPNNSHFFGAKWLFHRLEISLLYLRQFVTLSFSHFFFFVVRFAYPKT